MIMELICLNCGAVQTATPANAVCVSCSIPLDGRTSRKVHPDAGTPKNRPDPKAIPTSGCWNCGTALPAGDIQYCPHCDIPNPVRNEMKPIIHTKTIQSCQIQMPDILA